MDEGENSQASILAVKANALEVIVRDFVGYLYTPRLSGCAFPRGFKRHAPVAHSRRA